MCLCGLGTLPDPLDPPERARGRVRGEESLGFSKWMDMLSGRFHH